jgi:acetoin utilization deacetylase AcuC-like enzyme
MTYVFLEHPSSLEHDTAAYGDSASMVHPERPGRITAIEQELSARGWLGFERVRPPAVHRSVLSAVHPEPYVSSIELACRSGGTFLDQETVVSERSFQAALYAVGGAVRMVDLLLDGEASAAFSSHRPPGHHALPTRAMGFCMFNNIAVAARYALDVRRLERVMIIDWDVHHGNSTSHVFRATPQVLYVSIHQTPLFPWTGHPSDTGEGEGTGFTVNLPVPPGSGDELWISLVEHVVVPLTYAFGPQLVLISAGYDAHRDDPVADCTVTEEGFAAMTRAVTRACASLGVPVGAVLEGGYTLGALGRSVAATLQALSGKPAGGATAAAPTDLTPIARQARTRLADVWPQLRAKNGQAATP